MLRHVASEDEPTATTRDAPDPSISERRESEAADFSTTVKLLPTRFVLPSLTLQHQCIVRFCVPAVNQWSCHDEDTPRSRFHTLWIFEVNAQLGFCTMPKIISLSGTQRLNREIMSKVGSQVTAVPGLVRGSPTKMVVPERFSSLKVTISCP